MCVRTFVRTVDRFCSALEVGEYVQLPPVVPTKDFDVLGYWHDAGSPRKEPHGNVVAAAQFPMLATLARVYLCIDSTSCESEREFSGLGLCTLAFGGVLHPTRLRNQCSLG